MRLDRFTIKSQEALQDAQRRAEALEQQEVTPEHLLLSLMGQDGGVTAPLLQRIGANARLLKGQIEDSLKKLPKVYGAGGEADLSQRLKAVLEISLKEARDMKDEFVSAEHILLAITDERTGEAGKLLASHGVTRDTILKALTSVRGTQRVTDQMPEEKYQSVGPGMMRTKTIRQPTGDH